MKAIFKRGMCIALSLLLVCGILVTGFGGLAPTTAKAAMASSITLNGITLSRTAQTGEFVKKVGSKVESEAYKFSYYNYTANWSSLSLSGATNFAQNMDTAHPRLLIRDFSALLAQIDSDRKSADFYRTVKNSCDGYLSTAPYSFFLNERDNINDFSSNIEARLMQLSLVYNIEKLKAEAGRANAETDYKKYAERAILEAENASTFKHWSQDAFLCTAEIASGFAFAYDWLYDYLILPENADALKMIRDTVYNQAIVPFLYNYIVGKSGGTNFVETGMNWNPVCNGSAIIIGLSLYEPSDKTGKFSTICNYLFERGAEALWAGMGQYAEGGFYREGVSYWGYATEYFTRAVAAYEGLVPAGYTMPQRFTHILSEGVDETGFYPVYMNGITGAFNFGDCSSGFTLDTSMLYLANRFDKPELANYYLGINDLYGREVSGRDVVYALAWYKPQSQTFDYFSNIPLDKFHASTSDVNILSMRSSFEVNTTHKDNAYVAMQGGKNLANHMGYSMGTFVLDMGGKRFVKQHGQGNYAWSGYNGGAAAKAQYYIRRAEGNNTLIVDPTYSPTTGAKLANGEVSGDQSTNAFVTFVDSGTSDNVAYGVMDLTSTNVRLKKWHRGIMLADDRSRVIVQDEIAASDAVGSLKDVYWFAHIGDVGCVISDDGKTATLTSGSISIQAKITRGPGKFELVDAKPLSTSPNPEVQQSKDYGKKLQIHMTNIISATNTVEFAPTDAEGNLAYTKLENWSTLLSDDEDGEGDGAVIKDYLNTNNYETDWYKDSYQTYFIHDDKDLAGLAHLVNNGKTFEGKTVKLVNDITINESLQWVPIGTSENPFKGTFDGSQKTISGLYYTNPIRRNIGLFGVLDSATVKNLLLTDAYINANTDVGVLAGTADSSTILNVFVYDCTQYGQSRVGGIVGTQYGGSIINCGVCTRVYGQFANYGGIVGYTTGLVDNCAAYVQLCETTREVVTNESTGATDAYGVNLGSDYGGVAGKVYYGDVRNSYYNYIKRLNGDGTQPISKNSTNNSNNSLGKFTSGLAVSNISSTNSVLGYTKNGTGLATVMNCWISAQNDNAQYLTWETVNTGIFGKYARPVFVPETVEDTNGDALFTIRDAAMTGNAIRFNVSNEDVKLNTGYLVVVQKNGSVPVATSIQTISLDKRGEKSYSIQVADEVTDVQVFILDSFITMKIKSNTVNI